MLGDDVDGNVRPQGAASDLGADELLEVGLRVTKQASAAAFYPSATYVYTVTAYNDGVNPASSLVLADDLPLELRATAANITAGSCTLDPAWGGVTLCNVGTLAAGATVTLTLSVETAPATSGTLVTNVVTAVATETQNGTSLATPFHTCRTRLNDASITYNTVQAAIDAATSPTDVVKISGVCAGVNDYGGLAELAYLDHSLTLQGGWNSDFTVRDTALYSTTLNALGLGRVIYAHTGVSVTIEGVSLTGGNASQLGGASLNVTEGAGGALYVQYGAATLRDTTIYGNYASTTSGDGYGGGIATYNAALTVTNSIIRENVASLNSNGAGGGLYLYQDELNSQNNYNVLIQNCQLLTNTASVAGHAMGGALRMTYYYYGQITLRDNVLRGNHAASGNGEGKGGGFYCSNSSNSTATRLEQNQILYTDWWISVYRYTVPPPVVPPMVVSSTRVDPDPTTASQVRFDVTFSEAVSGVDTADFALTTAGTITGARVSSVTEVSADKYQVTVYTGGGSGTLRLDVPASATITDLDGNALASLPYTSGEAYTLERPVAIVRADANPTGAASVRFNVIFAESALDVAAEDFSIRETETLAGSSITSVSGYGWFYEVTVQTGAGSGTLHLDIPETATILDQEYNNLLAGLLPYTEGEAYDVIKSASGYKVFLPLVLR